MDLQDVLMLVEHPSVYTLGSSSSLDELFVPFEQESSIN
jgi:lipoate-protein ligase B